MPSEKRKRKFKRYRHASECSLLTQGKSYRCKTIDYSLKGIGFFMEDVPFLTKASPAHLKDDDLNIDEDVQIVWSRTSDSYCKGGIERKSISGLLRHFPFADIIIDLQGSEKTGILEVVNESVIKRIFIKNGDMVYATSNQQKERFVEDIILSIFQWEEGKFIFTEGPLLFDNAVELDTASIIYRGIKKIITLSHIRKGLPPLKNTPVSLMDNMNFYNELPLDGTDRNVLSLVDGRHSIQDIISLSPADAFQTMKTLYALLNTRIINIHKKRLSEKENPEDVLKQRKSGVSPDFLEKVEEVYSKLNSLDYYDFLNIPMRATLSEIKKAYYTLAKEFHPDKHLRVPSDSLKNKMNTIFSYLTQAYRILSDPEKRMEYDRNTTVRHVTVQGPDLQTNKTDLARTRYLEGKEAFRTGKYAEARELFGQALYLDNTEPAYYFSLGLAFEKENNFREAGKMVNEALKRDPANPDYLSKMGNIYLDLGFTLRARSTFEKALQYAPLHKDALEGLQKIRNTPK